MPPGTPHDAEEMLRQMHRRGLWAAWSTLMLGAWLAIDPFVAPYESGALGWSVAGSGVLVVALSLLALRENDTLPRWLNAAVGMWLLLAPLVFWAPTPHEYHVPTLAGALVIALAILVPPGMPGKAHHRNMMRPGPELPPGWSYNPSSWLQRAPVIGLAIASFLLARHLAAFQLGHIGAAWDPFFGLQTERVLTSDVSEAWPVSDAGLGAVAYLIEGLSGLMGGEQRWRTMPWMVAMFGVLVIPLGLTSIVLVMLQPVIVGAWCTICLLTALLMLLMIPLALDEVVAMLQFLRLARREGQDLWRVFWVGGTLDARAPDGHTPRLGAPAAQWAPATWWGVGVPWSLALAFLVGVALLAAPDLIDMEGAARANVVVSGTTAAVVAVVAWAEVARPLRALLLPLGAWITASAWLLPGVAGGTGALIVALLGIGLMGLGLPRGAIRERYGGASGFARWRILGRREA